MVSMELSVERDLIVHGRLKTHQIMGRKEARRPKENALSISRINPKESRTAAAVVVNDDVDPLRLTEPFMASKAVSVLRGSEEWKQ
jgi:hypothetical protein